MKNENYTTSFTVNQSAREVFDAIGDPRRWWSEAIEGDTGTPGSVFYYHFQNLHHCTIKVAESVPGKKVVWHVLRNDFNFVQDRNEWTGTDITFEIAPKGDRTEVRFTHLGLVPQYECYDVCSEGWRTYIDGSLRSLIATGVGRPNVGEAATEGERALSR